MSYKETFKGKAFPKTSEMVSLYEYFGKPQGAVRGQMAWQQSIEDGVVSGHKDVESTSYTGKVRTYPCTWLDKLDMIDAIDKGEYKSDEEVINEIVQSYEKR